MEARASGGATRGSGRSMVARSGGGIGSATSAPSRAAIALAMAVTPSALIASSSQPHPHHERRRSSMATEPSLRPVDNGYLYDLLRKLGLTDFGARTGAFLLENPIRIGLTLLAAWI